MQPASLVRCRLARFCAAATWLRGHPHVAAAISSSVLLAAALAAKALSEHETADDARAAWSFWAEKDPILPLFAPKSEGGSGAWVRLCFGATFARAC
jgi:hypothetical protein